MFVQQYILQKGLLKFGNKGYKAAMKEAKQLHDRKCFAPIKMCDRTKSEREKAQVALTYLTEKHNGDIKGYTIYNGNLLENGCPNRIQQVQWCQQKV